MLNDLGAKAGISIVPPADGHENSEFEARIAEQLILANKGELQRDIEELERRLEDVQRDLRYGNRLLRRSRLGRVLDIAWKCWAYFWGLAAAAIPIAFASVYAVSGGQEVVRATGAPRLETGRVHEGGIVQWTQSLERLEVCPGDAVLTLSPVAAEGGGVITLRRPIASPVAKSYPDQPFAWQLPLSMPDGHWRVNLSFDSRCPLRSRLDSLSTFDIEVLP